MICMDENRLIKALAEMAYPPVMAGVCVTHGMTAAAPPCAAGLPYRWAVG